MADRGRESTIHDRDQLATLEVSGPVAGGTTYRGKAFPAFGTLSLAKRINREPFYTDGDVPVDYIEGPGELNVEFVVRATIDDPAIFDALYGGNVEIIGKLRIKGEDDGNVV